jgi:hypothetical protein
MAENREVCSPFAIDLVDARTDKIGATTTHPTTSKSDRTIQYSKPLLAIAKTGVEQAIETDDQQPATLGVKLSG